MSDRRGAPRWSGDPLAQRAHGGGAHPRTSKRSVAFSNIVRFFHFLFGAIHTRLLNTASRLKPVVRPVSRPVTTDSNTCHSINTREKDTRERGNEDVNRKYSAWGGVERRRRGGEKKTAQHKSVSGETLAPRVARHLSPRHFPKASLVGGGSARRVTHDENPVTKDKPRTIPPVKVSGFPFTVVSTAEPTGRVTFTLYLFLEHKHGWSLAQWRLRAWDGGWAVGVMHDVETKVRDSLSARFSHPNSAL